MKRKTLALTLMLTLLFSMVTVINLFSLARGNPARDIVKMGPAALEMWIKSPYNKTYNTNLIQLNLTASYFGPFTCEYSVDNEPFINVPKTERNPIGGGVVDRSILLNLADGSHTVVAKAGAAVACISFTIDTVPPYLSIMVPENQTYKTSDIPLEYTAAGYTQVSYSLDGKANVSITGNSTLRGVIDGPHSMILYGTSENGSGFASEPAYFGVSTGRPVISILTIENNTTYYTSNLDLIFYLSEPSPEITYSLDSYETVISGNVTLTDLPYGSHKLTLYAEDYFENYRGIDEVYFNIEISPIIWLTAFAALMIIGISLLVYFKKRKH